MVPFCTISREDERVLRAMLVGFILGFAVVAVVRLADREPAGPLLTAASAMKPGAALDRVAGFSAWGPAARLPVLI